jgi:hypothetical protein
MIFYYLGGVWTRFARIAWVSKGHTNIDLVYFCQGAKARSSVAYSSSNNHGSHAVMEKLLTCFLYYNIRYDANTR